MQQLFQGEARQSSLPSAIFFFNFFDISLISTVN